MGSGRSLGRQGRGRRVVAATITAQLSPAAGDGCVAAVEVVDDDEPPDGHRPGRGRTAQSAPGPGNPGPPPDDCAVDVTVFVEVVLVVAAVDSEVLAVVVVVAVADDCAGGSVRAAAPSVAPWDRTSPVATLTIVPRDTAPPRRRAREGSPDCPDTGLPPDE
jgi:hypothetical protein